MSAVKERIKELVDGLPEDVAVEVERFLRELAVHREMHEWDALAKSSFAAWFSDEEVEYTEADARS